MTDVIAAFMPMGEEEMRSGPSSWQVEEIVSTFRDAGFEAVGDTTFLELVERACERSNRPDAAAG